MILATLIGATALLSFSVLTWLATPEWPTPKEAKPVPKPFVPPPARSPELPPPPAVKPASLPPLLPLPALPPR